ncbi:MAG: aminotransferase class IV [Candidatus Levybacteria bacterium]|nr:aminotransferase class IV [Candidatus Levybacteria bacterium]
MKYDVFSLNGKILPIEKATISALNIEYSYGFGVYETIRVNNQIPYFVEQHIERLLNSAQIIELEHKFSKDELKEFVQLLINRLPDQTYNLKILLIGGKESLIYILPLSPLFPEDKLYRKGAEAITYNYERQFPQAKTLNMLGSYLAYKKAKENNCYEALMVDKERTITEGTRSNFFTIKDLTIFTVPKEKVLDGITKRIVLFVALKNGFNIVEEDIIVSELNKYDGAFITSTSFGVMPISRINDFPLPIPSSIYKLKKLYDDFLKQTKGVSKDL